MYVDVLLATYNGEEYLVELLESIVNQDYHEFGIIARDDGSTDRTKDILEDFSSLYPDKILVVEDDRPTGSAKSNFAELLSYSKADYVLFADQDDIWLPKKIQILVDFILEHEAKWGKEVPIYVFSDTVVTDSNLNTISESYFSFKKIDTSAASSLSNVLVCPPMLGCASVINRALRELMLPMPVDKITGHDWWGLLVAAVFGKVLCCQTPTVLYRIHGSNSSAQKEVRLGSYIKVRGKVKAVRRGFCLRQLQALALLERFGDHIPHDKRCILSHFLSIKNDSFFLRRIKIVKGRYLYPDLIRNVAMLLFV
ncbi:glycosyltransferase family 2 protein [uncultured Rhodospira sp.]|uniref:glycosyltransferase family 2 protein n=1 Tax=uncultured Rhodospira sp. TaxID=1936189 RepID=UPI00260CAF1E|nr:glycosyltransferase family 2 protein [uncultured Rhodospira sp.]